MSRSADPCKLRPQTVFSTRHSRQSRLILHWRSTGAEEQGRDMFCAVLAWSRVRFVRFGPDQTRTTTLELLAECFEELGGVPALVLTDRMSCLKAGVVANVVVPHPEYVAFATRFGLRFVITEREVLRPVPSRRPPVRAVATRTVDKRGSIRFGSGLYLV